MQKVNSTTDLGALVHQYRKAQQLTQDELAGVAGVGRRFISELEAGKFTCHTGKVLQVFAVLGIELRAYKRGE